MIDPNLCRSGQVTEKMLQTTDNKKFALIGFLEATAQVVSMICVSKLPGAVLFHEVFKINAVSMIWSTGQLTESFEL